MSATPREPAHAAAAARRRRVMIVAGEASGDLHGADLAAEILARDPGCDLFGIAGERMRAAGVRALTRTEDVAGLGLAELASTIRRTLGALRQLKAMLRSERPDLVILIDFAEFNMSLAGAAKRAGQERTSLLLEFDRRLSLPFLCLFLMFLGPPLALLSGKSGRLGGLTIGLAIFTVFYIILVYGENMARSGKVPHYVGGWMPVVVLGVASLWAFRKAGLH